VRRRWTLAICAVGALLVVGLGGPLAYLKLHENELVFRASESRARATGQLPADAERLTVTAPDGSALAAIILRPAAARDSGYWILHLHGNATTAFTAEQIHHCDRLRELGFSVMCFDYRGFGRSPGVASEQHLDEDAEAAFSALTARGVPPDHIIVWGHSLGSGPAVVLAAKHPVAALVLFGAFTSIPAAAEDAYPYLPVSWVAGIHFDNRLRIAQVHVPVLIAHARGDTMIPLHHGLELFAAANEPKRLLILDGPYHDGFGGHINALYDDGESLRSALSALLRTSLPPVRPAPIAAIRNSR
jgi:pimeloyl-ACP methyl ester carboxylesterase